MLVEPLEYGTAECRASASHYASNDLSFRLAAARWFMWDCDPHDGGVGSPSVPLTFTCTKSLSLSFTLKVITADMFIYVFSDQLAECRAFFITEYDNWCLRVINDYDVTVNSVHKCFDFEGSQFDSLHFSSFHDRRLPRTALRAVIRREIFPGWYLSSLKSSAIWWQFSARARSAPAHDITRAIIISCN